MEGKVGMNIVDQLLKLQDLDHKRDRLQRRLDQVPVLLKAQSDAVASAQAALQEQELQLREVRASIDRNDLEIKSKDAERDKVKTAMTQPRVTAKEYTILQEQLAGVLADIGSLTEAGVEALTKCDEAEQSLGPLRQAVEEAQAAHDAKKEELEGSLSSVCQELEERSRLRDEAAADVLPEPLSLYKRVRAKYRDALAAVDGTIDRAAGRIGNDLHCSACYMAVTSNDAVILVGGDKLLRCKSCTRILYVP
ncbi:MAG: hypothetical protein O7C98_09795 [Planctomycetota bacterium]|nr:hypothetical protein [Planctomycetota bacterium]